jgi:hypothetical protein
MDRVLPAVLSLLSLALPACNRTSEPDRSASPAPAAQASGGAGPTAAPVKARPSGPTDVVWDAPTSWIKADQAGPMRKATYHVPHSAYGLADAEDGELSVSQAGGTVDQNVARWALQLERKLSDAKRTEQRVNGLEVTVVEIHGDYTGMAVPGAPPPPKKPGYALLGAIVETSPPTFFKLTGPDQTVAAAQRDFDKLLGSLRAK